MTFASRLNRCQNVLKAAAFHRLKKIPVHIDEITSEGLVGGRSEGNFTGVCFKRLRACEESAWETANLRDIRSRREWPGAHAPLLLTARYGTCLFQAPIHKPITSRLPESFVTPYLPFMILSFVHSPKRLFNTLPYLLGSIFADLCLLNNVSQ